MHQDNCKITHGTENHCSCKPVVIYANKSIEHGLFPVSIHAVMHDMTDTELAEIRALYAKDYRCSEIDWKTRSFKIKAKRVVKPVTPAKTSVLRRRINGYDIHLRSVIQDGEKTVEIFEDQFVYAKVTGMDNNSVIRWIFEPSDRNCKECIENLCRKPFDSLFLLGQVQ